MTTKGAEAERLVSKPWIGQSVPEAPGDSSDRFAAAVWARFYPRARVFAATILGSGCASLDDAVQEAMTKVLANLGRYRNEYALSTWIYAIVRNHCRDVKKRNERHERRIDRHADPAEVVARYPGPEEALVALETRKRIGRAIESLPPRDRQIAYLRFFEELDYADIARIVKIPAGTARYRVHMIRKSLASMLEEPNAETR